MSSSEINQVLANSLSPGMSFTRGAGNARGPSSLQIPDGPSVLYILNR